MNKYTVLLLLLLSSLTGFFATAAQFDEQVFKQLDYGLYWAGAGNQFEKAGSQTATGSRFYNPSKPTLIYIHGWQKGSSKNQSRELFYSTSTGRPDVDFAEMWRAAGYNIGVMYWNQFADEDEVKNAEAKIWSAQGPKAMRWRDSNGDYHDGPTSSVTELLLNSYLDAMTNFAGNSLRFAGHSLGNQVALRLADRLHTLENSGTIASTLVPERIALLDAYYSNGDKSYLDSRWTGDIGRDIASRLIAADIVIESYRSSLTTTTVAVGDENKALHNMTAFVEMGTGFFNVFQQTEKHVAAIWLYLWSLDSAAPPVNDYQQSGVSASSSNETVRFWMNSDKRLKQDEGRKSKDPADNTFKTDKRL